MAPTGRDGIQGVGWWSFRTPAIAAARHWYAAAGFRIIDDGTTYFHLDGGHGCWINIGTLGGQPAPAAEPAAQRLCPVFAVGDLDRWRQTAHASGRPAVEHEGIDWLRDPAGNWLGLVQSPGQTSDGVHYLDRVIVRVPDPRTAAAFYAGVGFVEGVAGPATGIELYPDQGARLDLVTGEAPVTPVDDRNAMPACPIWRVHGFDRLVTAARAAGAGLMQRIDPPGGRILYLLDPFGTPLAFQERLAESDRPIDHAMRAEWLAG